MGSGGVEGKGFDGERYDKEQKRPVSGEHHTGTTAGNGRKEIWEEEADGGMSLFARQPSFGKKSLLVDVLQDDPHHKTSTPDHRVLTDGVETSGSSDHQFPADKDIESSDAQKLLALQTVNESSYQAISPLGSPLSGSKNPDPLLAKGAAGSGLPSIGIGHSDSRKKFSDKSRMNLLAAASIENDGVHQLKLQRQISGHENIRFGSHGANSEYLGMPSIAQSKSQFPELNKNVGGLADSESSAIRPDGQVEHHKAMTLSARPYHRISLTSQGAGPSGSSSQYANVDNQNLDITECRPSVYPVHLALQSRIANRSNGGYLAPTFESTVVASSITPHGVDSSSRRNNGFAAQTRNVPEMDLHRASKQDSSLLQLALAEQLRKRYGKAVAHAAQVIGDHNDPSVELGSSEDFAEIIAVHEACIYALFQPQQQFPIPLVGKSAALKNHHANATIGMEISYPGSHLANAVACPAGPCIPLRLGEHGLGHPSGFRKSGGDFTVSNNSDGQDNTDFSYPSFLEAFKNAKTRCFQLVHIKGHVFEFSADQYGSRFIQQKLETATPEEKTMVFEEIMPHILKLITDVFGNYVVQKLFEHGTPFQRRKLAESLKGRVLGLSLQMYGCRVVQKALEFGDLDQKIKMAKELDGNIMRCIRDQNGNHVIQKCIECVPQEYIQFIIANFYDNVVGLSTHPYGCRVIQRVLENCDDLTTQQIVIEEILESVCLLSQNQFGNYVVQHVLEHGRPPERSAIIRKFTGQIVQLSQQKFASNVIERGLVFGSREDRQLIISEILRASDENEPLQAMMKDQFANYVVQKVIETCDDWQRELILARIKIHLNTLRKYTYGKHIVSRVEKLVAAGERRAALLRHPHTF